MAAIVQQVSSQAEMRGLGGPFLRPDSRGEENKVEQVPEGSRSLGGGICVSTLVGSSPTFQSPEGEGKRREGDWARPGSPRVNHFSFLLHLCHLCNPPRICAECAGASLTQTHCRGCPSLGFPCTPKPFLYVASPPKTSLSFLGSSSPMSSVICKSPFPFCSPCPGQERAPQTMPAQ